MLPLNTRSPLRRLSTLTSGLLLSVSLLQGDDYADKVGSLEASWQDDGRLALSMEVMGMSIASDVEILTAELIVRLEVPGMAGLFAGRIKSGIEERLGGLLGVAQA